MLKDNMVVERIWRNQRRQKLDQGDPRPWKLQAEIGQPVEAAMQVGLGKVVDQSGKANTGTKGLEEANTGEMKIEVAWVRKTMKPYYPMTMEVLQINLPQCKAAYTKTVV